MPTKGDNHSVETKEKIQNTGNSIQKMMNNLYKKTYFSTPDITSDLDSLTSQINDNLDNISSKSKDNTGQTNISKLYSRILDSSERYNGSSSGTFNDLNALFEDGPMNDELYASFMNNYYLQEMDDEIDSICKYMPKLQEALETRKDNVLSADHFSEDYLTVSPDFSIDESTFNTRIENLKSEYGLLDLVESVYMNASKYGEEFIYVVPYDKALTKLMMNKPNTRLSSFNMESSTLTINEAYSTDNLTNLNKGIHKPTVIKKQIPTMCNKGLLSKGEHVGLELELCKSNIIESIVKNYKLAEKKSKTISESSLFNEDINIKINQGDRSPTDVDIYGPNHELSRRERILKDTNALGNLSFEGLEPPKDIEDKILKSNGENADNDSAKPVDGLVTNKEAIKKFGINVPGCIVRVLDHTQVKPIYIEDMCMGYYYIEFLSNEDELNGANGITNALIDPLTTNNPNTMGSTYDAMEADKQDQILQYLSGELSQYIDKEFINNNQDLRKEIYLILKNNDIFNTASQDRLKVTFIPPDEMIHVHFREDKFSHRGISDLDKALVPAKIYCSLYITAAIGQLTRGYDKRVYYVKQNIETNVARTLLNTIQQIKQSNFGIRQFRSINTILNITGRFNDFLIPKSPSGDSPIEFDVIPGQNVELGGDLLDRLEEMAINSTDVPLELIQARMSMDYATHYTMSSIKFLRKVYARQAQYQKFLSALITRIYNYEYNENAHLSVLLPPPVFLNVTNSAQIMDNAANFNQKIVDYFTTDEDDQTFKKKFEQGLMKNSLGSYLNTREIEIIKNRAKIETQANKSPDQQQ